MEVIIVNADALAFVENSELIKIIVKALDKAYGIDYRQMRENDDLVAHMFTGVWKICRFDTNLIETLNMDGVEVACCERHGWEIFFVVDHNNKRTFNVVSKNTIQRVRRKRGGKVPHYLRSFLYIENANVKAENHQMSFADYGYEGTEIDDFSDQEFLDDYERITVGVIDPNVQYEHFVIVYEADSRGIKDCSIVFFNPLLEVAAEKSIMNYMEPDYSELSAAFVSESDREPMAKGQSKVRLKAGLEKSFEHEPEAAPVASLQKESASKGV
jgi:hypothetical protein